MRDFDNILDDKKEKKMILGVFETSSDPIYCRECKYLYGEEGECRLFFYGVSASIQKKGTFIRCQKCLDYLKFYKMFKDRVEENKNAK